MAIGKWIGGVLGWIASGGSILGALAGYAIGSLIDGTIGGGSSADSDDYNIGGNGYDEGERNSFLFSMMVLSSYIIKADGKIMLRWSSCAASSDITSERRLPFRVRRS